MGWGEGEKGTERERGAGGWAVGGWRSEGVFYIYT